MVEVFKNTFRNEIKKKQPPLVDYSHAYNMESSIEFFGEITKEEMNDMESKMIFGFDDYTIKLLSVLDSRDKILMILFYVHKFKHEEIGDFFGITESAVGTRLYLSKKKIRQWVKKN